MKISAILTDIEGTTSSIDFVHQVLFPYAARKLPAFLREHSRSEEIRTILDKVRAETGEADADTERIVETLLAWISEDRKATPLKSLQGYIWRRGYEVGDLTGHVYADAAAGLKEWAEQGIALYIYSSGSVAAQQLLFGYSVAGDMRPLFSGYFDTHVGHKRDVRSYKRIAGEIGETAKHILFLSDVVEELDAAAAAGMQTTQLVRDERVFTGDHRIAHDFSEVMN